MNDTVPDRQTWHSAGVSNMTQCQMDRCDRVSETTRSSTMTATNHDDHKHVFWRRYDCKSGDLWKVCRCFFTFSLRAHHGLPCGCHGLWPSWLWPSWYKPDNNTDTNSITQHELRQTMSHDETRQLGSVSDYLKWLFIGTNSWWNCATWDMGS